MLNTFPPVKRDSPRTQSTDLGEIADNVRALPVDLTEDIKQEGLHVKVQRLVVQKQFGQQAEVLTWRGSGDGEIQLLMLVNGKPSLGPNYT